jgi:hypothetical protein
VERIDEAHNSGAGGVIAPAWRHRATPISGSATEEGAKECLPQEAMAGDKAETRWAPLAGHTEGATFADESGCGDQGHSAVLRGARLDAPFGAAVIFWPNRIREAPEGALDSGARIQT